MKWSKRQFDELYLIPSRNGVSRPTRVRGEGYKMINMGELFSYDRIPNIEMELVPLNDRELENYSVQQLDLLFARQSLVREGAGKCSIVKDIQEPTTYDSHIIRVRLNQELADPSFYYYFFKSPYSGMSSLIQQCAQSGIRGSELAKHKVIYPLLHIQTRIASILSAYDDLIENNLRRIKLLEESSMQLYREWFVRLRFPGYEHTKIIKGVPEGWEKGKIKNVASLNESTLPSFFNETIEYVDISSVATDQISETTTYDFKDAPGRARRIVNHGDIIWSCVRPNRRSHAIIWNPIENLIVSTGFAVLSPIKVPCSYLYYFTTTDEFVGYLEKRAQGVAYPAVKATDFEEAEIIVPSDSLLKSFDEIIVSIFEQKHNLFVQNQKLKQARDILLPKLMSGEVEV